MNYTQDSWNEYIDTMDDNASGYGFTAVGDNPDNFRLDVIPSDWEPELNLIPTIEIVPEVDGDYIYFMPIVKIPPLDSRVMKYADDIDYCLKFIYSTKRLGRFCKYLISHPYSIADYTFESEE